uniref:SAM domain-containing protein n=1 Tax=Coturnix japonica TaxID=93934 RepID=A0A8C2TW91_COTJA
MGQPCPTLPHTAPQQPQLRASPALILPRWQLRAAEGHGASHHPAGHPQSRGTAHHRCNAGQPECGRSTAELRAHHPAAELPAQLHPAHTAAPAAPRAPAAATTAGKGWDQCTATAGTTALLPGCGDTAVTPSPHQAPLGVCSGRCHQPGSAGSPGCAAGRWVAIQPPCVLWGGLCPTLCPLCPTADGTEDAADGPIERSANMGSSVLLDELRRLRAQTGRLLQQLADKEQEWQRLAQRVLCSGDNTLPHLTPLCCGADTAVGQGPSAPHPEYSPTARADPLLVEWLQQHGTDPSTTATLLTHGFTLWDLLGSATRDDLLYTGMRRGSAYRLWAAIVQHRRDHGADGTTRPSEQ